MLIAVFLHLTASPIPPYEVNAGLVKELRREWHEGSWVVGCEERDWDKLFMWFQQYSLLGIIGLTEEEYLEVGKITHFFSKICVAVVELKRPLKVGDTIAIKGPTTDIEQKVDSMQIEHESVHEAKAGQSIGMKVADRVRETDIVYKKL